MDLNRSVLRPLGMIALAVIVFVGIQQMAFIVAPVLMALFFAAVLAPVTRWLIRKKLPRGAAILVSFLIFAGSFLFLGLLIGIILVQIGVPVAENSAAVIAQAQGLKAQVAQSPALAQQLSGLTQAFDPSKLLDLVKPLISGLTSLLTDAIFIIIVFIFTLVEGPTIMARMEKNYGRNHIFPRKVRSLLVNIPRYFILRTIVNLFTGVGMFLVCLIFGIQGALLWGFLTFLLSYIPYIGMFIALVPAGIIVLVNGGMGALLLFILAAVVINGLAEQVVSPVVTKRGLKMSAILVLTSFLFWGWILGPYGYFLAIPATLMVLLFMSCFEETASLANIVSEIPEPAEETEAAG